MQKIKNYFLFTSSERRGVLALVVLIALIITATLIIEQLPASNNTDFSKFDEQIAAASFYHARPIVKKQEVILTKFNPNNLPADKWLSLGFTERQIRTIHNYESKGGSFKIKTDLKKMYSVSDSAYVVLEPYIDLPVSRKVKAAGFKSNYKSNSKANSTYRKTKYESKQSNISISINKASQEDLESLRGIGPYFAKRILKFRKKIGGFYTVDQLYDVYGLDSSKVNDIKDNLYIEEEYIRKYKLNSDTLWKAKYHPYFSKEIVNSIQDLKQDSTEFKDLNEIKASDLVDDKLYIKIVKYLKL